MAQPFILGQLPQNIALRLKETGVNVLGTDPVQIDTAEDRHKFSSVLDSIGVDQPEWTEVTTLEAAKAFAAKVSCVYLNISFGLGSCSILSTAIPSLSVPPTSSLALQ